jgi:RNA polymerase sigma-70 factor (ECF subfamily)
MAEEGKINEGIEEERKLIIESQQGNILSFEKLVLKYQNKIYNLAYYLTKNKEDAEDLAQIALIRVYQKIHKFNFKSSFSTYLYRIVYNVFLDEQKKAYAKQRAQEVSLEAVLESQDYGLKEEVGVSSTKSVEEEFEKQELREKVKEAITLLPPEFRIPLVMYHIQGFSYQEIASIMKTSIGTVMSRINRARQKLKKILLSHLSRSST